MRTMAPRIGLIGLAGLLLALAGCAGDDAAGPPPPTTAPPADDVYTPPFPGDVATTPPADTYTPPPEDIGPPDPNRDPCGGVTAAGRCVGDTLEMCVAGTGGAEPFLMAVSCGSGMKCAFDGAGAACVPRAECVPGASVCSGLNLAKCVEGYWQYTACAAGCNPSALGAFCPPQVYSEPYASHLDFEYRAPNADYTDWGDDVYVAAARQFLVVSFADGELLDAVYTDDAGDFTLDAVPAALEDGDDLLVTLPLSTNADGDIVYAVMTTGLTAAEHPIETVALGLAPEPTPWRWSWTAGQLPAAGGVYVPLASGSGAAFAYNYLRAIHDFGTLLFGDRPNTALALWLDYGVTWDCGACFLPAPLHAADIAFAGQIFMPANSDEAFWSGPVLAHELAHWLMSTFGTSPGEGGTHVMGMPSHPGLAWSEGFATWFSDIVRDQEYYFDKQRGTFFWIDHSARTYSVGVPWYRPVAEYGLEQLIDENEVTRMLLDLRTPETEVALLALLATPRMTEAPFARGYLRRTWDGLNADFLPLPAWSTDQSAPHLADFLDAMVCDGVVSAAAVDAQTEPWAHYPYPSAQPACWRPEVPVQVAWREGAGAPEVDVRWLLPLEEDLTVAFVPAAGAPLVIPAGTPPGATRLIWAAPAGGPTAGAGATPSPGPEAVEVHARGTGWHLDGRVARAPAPLLAPVATGPMAALGRWGTTRTIALPTVPPAARAPRREIAVSPRFAPLGAPRSQRPNPR